MSVAEGGGVFVSYRRQESGHLAARALVAIDPHRAAQLLSDAERTANSLADEQTKASALIDIVEALVATSS